jgi:hypothetical protein
MTSVESEHPEPVSFSRRATAPSQVLTNVMGGESVLLNLDSEGYYGLDEVGTRMWQVLIQSESIEHAFVSLLEEYDVDPERLRADLGDLVSRLRAHGLVELE